MLAHPEMQPRKVFGAKDAKRPIIPMVLVALGAALLVGAVGYSLSMTSASKPGPLPPLAPSAVAATLPAPAPLPVMSAPEPRPAPVVVAAAPAPVPIKAAPPAPKIEAPAKIVKAAPKATPAPAKKEPVAAKHKPEPKAEPKSEVKAAAPKEKSRAVVPAGPRETLGDTFRPMESAKGWKTHEDADGFLAFANVELMGQPAWELAYDMGKGNSVQISRDINANFSRYEWLKFAMIGEGASNTFEFRIEDKDGTISGIAWHNKTNKWAWSDIALPLSQLSVVSPGGDGALDWDQVRRISFVISLNSAFNDEGGKGRVLLRNVEFQ